jgi:hypothetical protein
MELAGLKCADLVPSGDDLLLPEPVGKVVVLASNGYTDTSRLACGAEVVSPLSRAPR